MIKIKQGKSKTPEIPQRQQTITNDWTHLHRTAWPVFLKVNKPTNFPKIFKMKYFQIFDQSDPSIFCHFRELIDTIVTTHTPNIVNFKIFFPDGNMRYEHQTKTRYNHFWWTFILSWGFFEYFIIKWYRKLKNIEFSKSSKNPAAIDINPYTPRILV